MTTALPAPPEISLDPTAKLKTDDAPGSIVELTALPLPRLATRADLFVALSELIPWLDAACDIAGKPERDLTAGIIWDVQRTLEAVVQGFSTGRVPPFDDDPYPVKVEDVIQAVERIRAGDSDAPSVAFLLNFAKRIARPEQEDARELDRLNEQKMAEKPSNPPEEPSEEAPAEASPEVAEEPAIEIGDEEHAALSLDPGAKLKIDEDSVAVELHLLPVPKLKRRTDLPVALSEVIRWVAAAGDIVLAGETQPAETILIEVQQILEAIDEGFRTNQVPRFETFPLEDAVKVADLMQAVTALYNAQSVDAPSAVLLLDLVKQAKADTTEHRVTLEILPESLGLKNREEIRAWLAENAAELVCLSTMVIGGDFDLDVSHVVRCILADLETLLGVEFESTDKPIRVIFDDDNEPSTLEIVGALTFLCRDRNIRSPALERLLEAFEAADAR